MNWTNLLPVASGEYWWRSRPGEKVYMRTVWEWRGGGFAVMDRLLAEHSDGICTVERVGGEWYGPLVPPG